MQPSLHKQSIGKVSREETGTTYHQPQAICSAPISIQSYSVYRSCDYLKNHNDIVNGIDKDQCTVLASLDLSAAFDTVDHDIIIDRMHAYGIRETALKWFQSYLDRRSYVTPLANVINKHSIN